MAVVRKKQDDKYLVVLREMITSCAGNRQCFDCGQKGPTYVNMTIGSFVCTRCSGVLRGLTPPHRVKSISMASFAQEDIDFLKTHGNEQCAQTWLGLWDPKRVIHQDHRELMIDKYERKRYYLEPASPLKSLTNAINMKTGNYHTTNITHHNGQSTQTSINCNMSNNLSPTSSQRPASNVLQNSSNLSSAISRPHHDHQLQNDYQNHHMQHNDISFINNNLSPNTLSVIHNTDTTSGAIPDTISCASNTFNPNADFVADFNSASIFNAVFNSPHSSAVSSAPIVLSNVYAKIQPRKLAQVDNGHVNNSGVIVNGYSTNNLNANENFADFDHAPIYNAAGLPMAMDLYNKIGTVNISAVNTHNNNSLIEDRYAALKDLDEQLRESKALTNEAALVVNLSAVDKLSNADNGSHQNPFKSLQKLSSSPKRHNGSSINPFQAQNFCGQMTFIPNGYGRSSQQQQQLQYAMINNNGGEIPNNKANNNTYPPVMGTGCGFGVFADLPHQQPIPVPGVGAGGINNGTYKNPFTTSDALKSNNPFL